MTTGLAWPTFLSLKAPVASAPDTLTASPEIAPVRLAAEVSTVATVVASYTRLRAVTPASVNTAGVMSASVVMLPALTV